MTTEEKLKEFILKRYHSIREFAISIDMPYTTLDSIFRRGIGNSSVTNVIKICKALNISVDSLADGEIVSVNNSHSTPINDRFEIKEILSDTKDLLSHRRVTIDGEPISKKGMESLFAAMDVGIELAKDKKS